MRTEPISPVHASLPAALYPEQPERRSAMERYVLLRGKLLALKAAAKPDLGAIEATVSDLEQAQLACKASGGLYGNNPC